MKDRIASLLPVWLVTMLLVPACSLPAWSGTVPPPVPVDDPCGSGALTAAGGQAIQRAPYLQTLTQTGVVVAWAGLPEPAARVVVASADPQRPVVGRFAASFPGSAALERQRRAVLFEELREQEEEEDPDETLEAGDFYLLAAHVRGLVPGTRYCYRIESDEGPLTDWASLTTAPPPDAERTLRLVVLGDTGAGSPAQIALARRIERLQVDAILFAGDLAYPAATHARLQTRFFDVYEQILRRVPAYPAIGNHDDRASRARPYRQVFILPGNERWYSIDLGRVHLVVVDTTRIGPQQARWLQQDLENSSAPITIVLGHHPPFTSAWRGPSEDYKAFFVPILERHGVELVVSGHEHHYERTRPINGVTYVVTGGGGGRLTPLTPSSGTVHAQAIHHYLQIEVGKDKATVQAVDIDGRIIDEFAIEPR